MGPLPVPVTPNSLPTSRVQGRHGNSLWTGSKSKQFLERCKYWERKRPGHRPGSWSSTVEGSPGGADVETWGSCIRLAALHTRGDIHSLALPFVAFWLVFILILAMLLLLVDIIIKLFNFTNKYTTIFPMSPTMLLDAERYKIAYV